MQNCGDEADSSNCEDLNGVENVMLPTFICRPIRKEVKSMLQLLVCRLGRSHQYAEAQPVVRTLAILGVRSSYCTCNVAKYSDSSHGAQNSTIAISLTYRTEHK